MCPAPFLCSEILDVPIPSHYLPEKDTTESMHIPTENTESNHEETTNKLKLNILFTKVPYSLKISASGKITDGYTNGPH